MADYVALKSSAPFMCYFVAFSSRIKVDRHTHTHTETDRPSTVTLTPVHRGLMSLTLVSTTAATEEDTVCVLTCTYLSGGQVDVSSCLD